MGGSAFGIMTLNTIFFNFGKSFKARNSRTNSKPASMPDLSIGHTTICPFAVQLWRSLFD